MERGWTTDAEAITWLEGFLKATKLYKFLYIMSGSNHPAVRSDPNAWRGVTILLHSTLNPPLPTPRRPNFQYDATRVQQTGLRANPT